MSYRLVPLNSNVSLVELKSKEVNEYTGKYLTNPDSDRMNVLNYGRIVESSVEDFKTGDIVLFQKLAAHRTNFGTPRVLVVPVEQIEAKLKETK